MSVLVIDVGTSSIRARVAHDDASPSVERQRPLLPTTPFPGLVEFDPVEMLDVALELAHEVLAAHGAPVDAVGITNQRASTVVWDPTDGRPVGPGIGWQDLRTVGECLTLQADGLHLAPNHSATKCAALLDAADPERRRHLLFGTVDSWLVWNLSRGSAHVTDASNASVTGLLRRDGSAWDGEVLARLRIDPASMPTLVDTSGHLAEAVALPGSPPITGLAGDQQASLIGQGCVEPGLAKLTFGTGGMLDLWVGDTRPSFELRGDGGTFPLVADRRDGALSWALEGVMLAAGSNVEWLRDDLGLVDTAAESHDLAARCDSTDGVVYVPALLGLGTPHWDYGARGALLGVTRGTTAAHVARAVLEGVAHRGTDLVDAAETDSGLRIDALRVDGGMSQNPTFVQALADASQRPVELSPEVEATARGAALLALVGAGTIAPDDLSSMWSPRSIVEPGAALDRARWADAVDRSRGWHGDLSALTF
jgi:glycerol kinase